MEGIARPVFVPDDAALTVRHGELERAIVPGAFFGVAVVERRRDVDDLVALQHESPAPHPAMGHVVGRVPVLSRAAARVGCVGTDLLHGEREEPVGRDASLARVVHVRLEELEVRLVNLALGVERCVPWVRRRQVRRAVGEPSGGEVDAHGLEHGAELVRALLVRHRGRERRAHSCARLKRLAPRHTSSAPRKSQAW